MNKDALENKHILTIKDVMEILGIGQNKAYKLAHGNYFPTKRLNKNGKFLIPKEPFFEWLNNSQDEILE